MKKFLFISLLFLICGCEKEDLFQTKKNKKILSEKLEKMVHSAQIIQKLEENVLDKKNPEEMLDFYNKSKDHVFQFASIFEKPFEDVLYQSHLMRLEMERFKVQCMNKIGKRNKDIENYINQFDIEVKTIYEYCVELRSVEFNFIIDIYATGYLYVDWVKKDSKRKIEFSFIREELDWKLKFCHFSGIMITDEEVLKYKKISIIQKKILILLQKLNGTFSWRDNEEKIWDRLTDTGGEILSLAENIQE